MSLFKIPKGVTRDINRLLANFWWGGSEGGKTNSLEEVGSAMEVKMDRRFGLQGL